MANLDQLKILKNGVFSWNGWMHRKNPALIADLSRADLQGISLGISNSPLLALVQNPFEKRDVGINFSKVDLSESNLSEAKLPRGNLIEANLKRAKLNKIDLSGANLSRADLREVDLQEANLSQADLSGANLKGAKLKQVDLTGAKCIGTNISEVDLSEAKMNEVDFSGADLSGTVLKRALLIKGNFYYSVLSGTNLYGTARDDWKIEGITCDYIFWDEEGKNRTPKNRDFRPGEFEALYKQLPTFDYYFENGFRPIDSVLMSRIVEEINQKNPEFELKLDSFHSRGQPHAKFTVLHKESVEQASSQVASEYQNINEKLDRILCQFNRNPTIAISFFQEFIMNKSIHGDNFENINQLTLHKGAGDIIQPQSGSTVTIHKGSSPEEFTQYLDFLLQELRKQDIPEETREEIEHELNGARIQAKKKDNKKISERLKNAAGILKNCGLSAQAAVNFGNMIGKAIEWCGEQWIDILS